MPRPEKEVQLGKMVLELFRNDDVPAEARLNGIFLLMTAHGLSCDQKRRAQIEKRFSEFEAQQRRLRKKQ